MTDVAGSYDAVAREYDRRISGELQHKPFDRTVLERFARAVRSGGTVADVGCGPGHVGRYVSDQGVRVCGLDISEEMIVVARIRNPGMDLFRADMRAIPMPDAAWAGIVAFYSIIHIAREEVVSVLRELARVLEPGGLLLIAFHIGHEAIHLEEWWEQKVSVLLSAGRDEGLARRGRVRSDGSARTRPVRGGYRTPEPALFHHRAPARGRQLQRRSHLAGCRTLSC